MNHHLKSPFLLLVALMMFACLPLSGQINPHGLTKGKVWIKTDPIWYYYPLYNMSVQIGLGNNKSLDLMGGWYPEEKRVFTLEGTFNAIYGKGITTHAILRSYVSDETEGFFWGLGLMYKQWAYSNAYVREGDSVVRQYRQAFVPGIKLMGGFEYSLLKWFRVEAYAGVNAKFRYEEFDNRPTGTGNSVPQDLGERTEFRYVPGLVFGVNVGPVFNFLRAKEK